VGCHGFDDCRDNPIFADDLKYVSREHGVSFANAATGVDGHYVHLPVMTMACRKMVDVAEKLESVAYTLRNALTEESPPREVQDEMISRNLDDSGWVYGLGLLCWLCMLLYDVVCEPEYSDVLCR
jgi:hypothetical protein